MVVKPGQQEREAASHIVPQARSREVKTGAHLTFSSVCSLGTRPTGMVLPTLTVGFPTSVLQPSQSCLEVCLLGDFRSDQIGNNDYPSNPGSLAQSLLAYHRPYCEDR